MNDGNRTRPSLLLLFGPPAVGKTTVGQELERLTGFRLFHLHQIIDLVTQYFPYVRSPDAPYYRLIVSYRRQFFEEAARSGLQIISTDGCPFPPVGRDVRVIQSYVQPFMERRGQIYFVRLAASLETRLARNLTENRRRLKRVDWSTEEYLRRDAALHDYDRVAPFEHPFLHIETDGLSVEETAERICAHFGLPRRKPTPDH
jgi:hypothetical protein